MIELSVNTCLMLTALGFVVGMLTGTLGVGGAFLLTPALNIIGMDMVSAIGTGFVSLAAKWEK
jgi:uncharacterized protein